MQVAFYILRLLLYKYLGLYLGALNKSSAVWNVFEERFRESLLPQKGNPWWEGKVEYVKKHFIQFHVYFRSLFMLPSNTTQARDGLGSIPLSKSLLRRWIEWDGEQFFQIKWRVFWIIIVCQFLIKLLLPLDK